MNLRDDQRRHHCKQQYVPAAKAESEFLVSEMDSDPTAVAAPPHTAKE